MLFRTPSQSSPVQEAKQSTIEDHHLGEDEALCEVIDQCSNNDSFVEKLIKPEDRGEGNISLATLCAFLHELGGVLGVRGHPRAGVL